MCKAEAQSIEQYGKYVVDVSYIIQNWFSSRDYLVFKIFICTTIAYLSRTTFRLSQ
jgi:hypothetical protein